MKITVSVEIERTETARCDFCGKNNPVCFRSPMSFREEHTVDICENCIVKMHRALEKEKLKVSKNIAKSIKKLK